MNYDETAKDYRFQFVNESNPSIGWGNNTKLLLGNSTGVNVTLHHEYEDYVHKVVSDFRSSFTSVQLFTKGNKSIDLRVQRAPHNQFISTHFFFFLYHPSFVQTYFKRKLTDEQLNKGCPQLKKYDSIFHIE